MLKPPGPLADRARAMLFHEDLRVGISDSTEQFCETCSSVEFENWFLGETRPSISSAS
jgi:hypothetical protein